MLVHAPHQEGDPAAIPFEEGDAKPRMAFEDAAHAEAAGRKHHLDRMAIDVLEHRVGTELLADLRQQRAGSRRVLNPDLAPITRPLGGDLEAGLGCDAIGPQPLARVSHTRLTHHCGGAPTSRTTACPLEADRK